MIRKEKREEIRTAKNLHIIEFTYDSELRRVEMTVDVVFFNLKDGGHSVSYEEMRPRSPRGIHPMPLRRKRKKRNKQSATKGR